MSKKLVLTDEEAVILTNIFGEGWAYFQYGHDTYARENKSLLSEKAAVSLKEKIKQLGK